MKKGRGSSRDPQRIPRPKKRIRTTMFDLIKALTDEIKPGEEVLVPLIVLDMMETGLLKFIGHPNAAK